MINSMICEPDIIKVPSDFGIDPDSPLPDEEVLGKVEVPESPCPLTEDCIEEFIASIDTSSTFDDLGIVY